MMRWEKVFDIALKEPLTGTRAQIGALRHQVQKVGARTERYWRGQRHVDRVFSQAETGAARLR